MSSSPYLGEVRAFAFGFTPKGWAACNGQLLSIQQNAALFSILGTFYGGNGVQTFALPNLQGNLAMGMGTGGGGTYVIGETGGEVNHTLLQNEMPLHTHTSYGGGTAASNIPTNQLPGNNPINKTPAPVKLYAASGTTAMNPAAAGTVGGNLAHNNMGPYLVINFCIALSGIFPSRN
jgi:microcystin-dependent protein